MIKPRIQILILGLVIWDPNLRFFWFGLGLGYVIVCDLTLEYAQVRSVILIKELALPADRIRSHFVKNLFYQGKDKDDVEFVD